MKRAATCPTCGNEMHPNALSCPNCGARKTSDGRHTSDYDGLDLPDEDFDYDEFIKREFDQGLKPPGIPTRWWIVAIIILIAFLLGTLRLI